MIVIKTFDVVKMVVIKSISVVIFHYRPSQTLTLVIIDGIIIDIIVISTN